MIRPRLHIDKIHKIKFIPIIKSYIFLLVQLQRGKKVFYSSNEG